MSGVGTAPPLPKLPPSPTAFTINVNWDNSVATAPTGFTSDVAAAVRYLEFQFSDPVTITIDVGYNELAGQSLSPRDLGESETFPMAVSYANLRTAVIDNAKTSIDASVVNSLPATSPLNGATYFVTPAQAKALGLLSANAGGVDGYIGFGAASNFTFGDTASGGRVASGTYDFFSTVVHEITEVMGRTLFTTRPFDGASQALKLLDLLHYSGAGIRDFSATTPGYFSVNGGGTNLGEFNPLPPGDAGDWASSMGDNPFDAYGTPGAADAVTSDDLAEMDAIGWNPAGTAATITPVKLSGNPIVGPAGTPGTSSLPPIFDPISQLAMGVSFSPEPPYLAIAEAMSPGTRLATVVDDAEAAGGNFTYALSGPGAGAFTLSPTGGGAVLAVGANIVAGAAGGTEYAMTVTATGSPSASGPVNVVVGSAGDETITLASLPGMVTSAPTFIYGLGGNDIINGTGMSGALYFDAGTGVDMMAGGGGRNVYEFGAGAGAPATATVQDIITNFNASVDLIDLTWIGWRFSGTGALGGSATAIPAGSIGWQSSGGNTFVYANTSNQTEALAATDVRIELEGSIALTSANFAHP